MELYHDVNAARNYILMDIVYLHGTSFLFRKWSDEGVETLLSSGDRVECVTNHLTSFAVLVDHRGIIENEVSISFLYSYFIV